MPLELGAGTDAMDVRFCKRLEARWALIAQSINFMASKDLLGPAWFRRRPKDVSLAAARANQSKAWSDHRGPEPGGQTVHPWSVIYITPLLEFNMYSHLDNYMATGFKEVEGWCSSQLSEFCKLIDSHQRERQIAGGVAEIGVHHGLFFIMLNSFCQDGCTSWALDLFERQDLNIDHSGQGSKEVFLANLEAHDKFKGKNVQIVACDSTTVRLTDIVKSPVRLFSIDGGHTAEHTISDLKSAQSVLHPEGVVILDDIQNHHWLGVIEGCILFLQARPTLVPFAIGHNKLFMCNLSFAEPYMKLFLNSRFVTKPRVRFVGHEIVAL